MPPPPPPGSGGPTPGYGYGYPLRRDHPQATTALILGIIGLVACQLLSPVALVVGRRAMNQIDRDPEAYGGRGMATAGFVLGIIGTAFLALALAFLVLVIVVAIVGSDTEGNLSLLLGLRRR